MDWIECHTFMSRPLGPESVVLDLGANHAGFSTAVAERYGCRCIAVEPTPELHRGYAQHPRIEYVQAAASGRSARAQFWPMPCDQASTLMPQAEGDSIEVDCLTLGDLLERFGLERVDLVKIDIEGAEIGLLDAATDEQLSRCDQFTIEFHDFNGMVSLADVERVLGRLASLGFVWAKMSPRSRGHHDTMIVHGERLGLGRLERFYVRHLARYRMGGPRVLRRWLGLGRGG